jgi:hypothetical protein
VIEVARRAPDLVSARRERFCDREADAGARSGQKNSFRRERARSHRF